MKEAFITKNFRESSLEIILQANVIIGELQAEGYDLTLRQLYYQFVSRAMIENTQKSYDRLGAIINDARLAGLVDWNAIRDRTRFLRGSVHYNSVSDLIDSCVYKFKVDKWQYQDWRVEVWIEKDALIGVIEKTCYQNDVDFFSCRGYVSQSFMYDAAERLQEYIDDGKSVKIIHLGDHDPSGIDMTRDIEDRLNLFLHNPDELFVDRVALNMDQIEQFKPPPNPTKLTDSRAKDYIKKFGYESWELDALPPRVINELITDEIDLIRDQDYWAFANKEQREGREKIKEIAKGLNK